MDLIQAPTVLTPRKSRLWLPRQIEAASRVARGIRGLPLRLPVWVDNEPFGIMESDHTREVRFAPFSGTDSLISNLLAGQRLSRVWNKNLEAWTTALASRWADLWNIGGEPQGGTYSGTALTARQLDDTVDGSLAHGGNVSPKTKQILNGWSIQGDQFSTIILYDRVLTYENCVISSSTQTMDNTLAAQRYISVGQPGLMWTVLAQAQLNNTITGMTQCVYVNQAGATQTMALSSTVYEWDSHTTTISNSVPAIVAIVDTNVGAFPFLPLMAGDSGMQSITSITSSSGTATSGTVTFVLMRPLAVMANSANFTPSLFDFTKTISSMPIVYDGAHISMMLWSKSAVNNAYIQGGLDFGWA